MSLEVLTIIGLVLQIATFIALIILTVRLMAGIEFSPLGAFFTIGMASFLLSDLYWIAFTLLESDIRMPFAVNEIGECACILLLATAMRSQLSDAPKRGLRDILPPALFTLCNVALWIGWSGEWAQDIMSGLALGYYLVIAVGLLRQEAVLSHREWVAFGAIAVLLVALQGLTFAVGAPVRSILDVVCTALMALSILFFFAKSITALRRSSRAALPLTFSSFGWMLVCLYMSAGVPWLVIAMCITLVFPLMYQAVKGRVMEA